MSDTHGFRLSVLSQLLSENGPQEPERAIAYDGHELSRTAADELPNTGLTANLVTPHHNTRRKSHNAVVDHEGNSHESKLATLTIDGQSYRVQLVPEENASVRTASAQSDSTPTLLPLPAAEESDAPVELVDISFAEHGQRELDLASALGMVGGQHPIIGYAQWRVQEAYAQLDQAELLWLPSLQAGFSYHRHDGNYQASRTATSSTSIAIPFNSEWGEEQREPERHPVPASSRNFTWRMQFSNPTSLRKMPGRKDTLPTPHKTNIARRGTQLH